MCSFRTSSRKLVRKSTKVSFKNYSSDFFSKRYPPDISSRISTKISPRILSGIFTCFLFETPPGITLEFFPKFRLEFFFRKLLQGLLHKFFNRFFHKFFWCFFRKSSRDPFRNHALIYSANPSVIALGISLWTPTGMCIVIQEILPESALRFSHNGFQWFGQEFGDIDISSYSVSFRHCSMYFARIFSWVFS